MARSVGGGGGGELGNLLAWGRGELGNLLSSKIIIQMVIRRSKVCSSTGFFLA